MATTPDGYDTRGPQEPAYGDDGRPVQRGSNGVAVAALVLGLLSVPLIFLLFLGVLTGLVAIVLGIVGVRKASAMGGTGKGMAITGILGGVVAIVLAALLVAGLFQFVNSPEVQQQIEEELEQATEGGG